MIASLVAALVAASTPAPVPTIEGIWVNPAETVHVRIAPCGERLCGTVVWANQSALDDAREGGTDKLVGMQLFEEFKPGPNGTWRGRVFVPSYGRTFSGRLRLRDANAVDVQGCIFAGLICRTQTWARVAEPQPHERREEHEAPTSAASHRGVDLARR